MSIKNVKKLSLSSLSDGNRAKTPKSALLTGDGEVVTWFGFTSEDGTTVSGIWSSEPFSKKKAHPDEMEFCYLIEGDVKLTDSEGNSQVFSAGEALVVTPGFDGIWESVSHVKKYFVITKC
ncbi:MAG: cupin domain-containing protein [Pseudomonadota bacterium]